MNKVIICTDSTCDLSEELVKKYNLRWGWSDMLAQWKDEQVLKIMN